MYSIQYMKDRILDIIKKYQDNNDGGFKIYRDYRDQEAFESFIPTWFKSEDPQNAMNEEIWEWETQYDIVDEIKEYLTTEEKEFFDENENEMTDFVREHAYMYYNIDDFDCEVNVNILIDTGNWNYDCTCDNVLNWYGNSGDGSIDENSSMLWLAKTQKKATKLRKACKAAHRNDGYYVNREKDKDKFIESCIQEFENLPSHMATVTFLTKIRLLDLFKLIEIQKKEYDAKYHYEPQKNPNAKSYIVLGKETMCGLFDTWSGGGSVLEVELDKDVKIPLNMCKLCVDGTKHYGYDVNEVYGLIDSCWKDSVKEIKEVI